MRPLSLQIKELESNPVDEPHDPGSASVREMKFYLPQLDEESPSPLANKAVSF